MRHFIKPLFLAIVFSLGVSRLMADTVPEIVLTPSASTIEKGQTLQLLTTVSTGSVNQNYLSYYSSDENVATVTSGGVVLAHDTGIVVITVQHDSIATISATSVVTVINSQPQFVVMVSENSLLEGDTAQLVVTQLSADTRADSYVFTSSDETVAVVQASTYANGIIVAKKVGTAYITVTSDAEPLNPVTVRVNVVPRLEGVWLKCLVTDSVMEIGTTQTILPYYLPVELEKEPTIVSYVSSDISVVSVSFGTLIANSAGTSEITITDSYGRTASVSITVVAGRTFEAYATKNTISVGDTAQLLNRFNINIAQPSDPSVMVPVYTSDDESVATIDTTGVITGISAGVTIVKVRVAKVFVDSVVITVINSEQPYEMHATITKNELFVGDTAQITYKFVGEQFQYTEPYVGNISFTSSDESVATVSASGVVTAIGTGAGSDSGSAVIIVSVAGYTSTIVVVVKPVVVELLLHARIADTVLQVGSTTTVTADYLPFEPLGTYTFVSSHPEIASVNAITGVLAGVSPGSALITVTDQDGRRDSVVVTIVEAAVKITSVNIVNGGYTLEITFDKPVELYEGIENDFTINPLIASIEKSSSVYTINKVMRKEGEANTLVLMLDNPVPAGQDISVSFDEKASFDATTVNEAVNAAAKVFPNPATGIVNFEAAGLQEVELSSIDSKFVVKVTASDNRVAIDTDGLPGGYYVAKLFVNTGVIAISICVK